MQTFIHYIMGFYACLQIKQAVCVISYGALSSIVYTYMYTNTEMTENLREILTTFLIFYRCVC